MSKEGGKMGKGRWGEAMGKGRRICEELGGEIVW